MNSSKPMDTRALETRRERNRNSQRVARQKQANYIRELEERIKSLKRPDNDRITQLEEENSRLRNQLLDLHKVLESVQSTLRTISNAASAASGAEEKTKDFIEQEAEPIHEPAAEVRVPARGLSHGTNNHHGISPEGGNDHLAISGMQCGAMDSTAVGFPFQPLAIFQPGQFMNAPSIELTSSTGELVFGINLPSALASQSSLGNHLALMRYFLQPQFISITGDYTSVSKLAVFMFSAFAACAWPALRTYFMHTRAHVNLSKILMWRAYPTETTQALLQPRHAPTLLQLAENYPLAIDIIPFPSVRDRLITYHASDPGLDQMICEIANDFVVETNLADMVVGLPSTPGFVGVWDLARAMDNDELPAPGPRGYHAWASAVVSGSCDTHAGDTMGEWFPATSVKEIFEDPMKARAAFNFLRMNRGAVHWRLDPELFIKHPHLLDLSNDPRAKGVRMAPPQSHSIPVPRHIDMGAASMYREFSTLTIDSFV